jgi:cell division protease FtsH
VILVAATNRPDVLDPALLRPGLFDRRVVVGRPDVGGREAILKVHTKKVPLGDDVDLSVLARGTPGLAGAELANLVNEAALYAARQNRKVAMMIDFELAKDKILMGAERRSMILTDAEKRTTAYHEAGHAIVQAVIDDGKLPLHKVTIIPRGQSLGSTMFAPTKDILNHGFKQLLTRLCTLMGGRVAEEIQFGNITSGAAGDIKMATKIARQMVCDWGMSPLGPIALGDTQDQIFLAKEISRSHSYSEETARRIDFEIHRIVEEQYQRAKEILTKHREGLDKVAGALLEFETIDGKHVHEILDTGAMTSPVVSNPPRKPAVPPVVEPTKRKTEELGPGPAPAGMPA